MLTRVDCPSYALCEVNEGVTTCGDGKCAREVGRLAVSATVQTVGGYARYVCFGHRSLHAQTILMMLAQKTGCALIFYTEM